MIFLITGALGAGKTSNTIWHIINDPDLKDRPKFATYIKGFKYDELDFEQIDKKDLENWVTWTDPNDDFSTVSNFPKGSLILIDEADLFFPATLTDKNPPRWLREMARSRHHGLDFYIITQKATMVSPFLLGLIQTHIFYHRPNGADYVNRYSWEQYQPNVNARSNRISGLPQKIVVPQEVFTLYESTVENTRVKTPPIHIYKKLALFLLPMLLAPFLVWYLMYYRHLPPEVAKTDKQQEVKQIATSTTTPTTQQATAPQNQTDLGSLDASSSKTLTIKDFVPPVPSMPWAAPAYADLVKPTDFPRIAACVSGKSSTNKAFNGCRCFTQQYTPIDVPQESCERMVKEGWFDNWATGRSQQENVLTGKSDESSARQQIASKQEHNNQQSTSIN